MSLEVLTIRQFMKLAFWSMFKRLFVKAITLLFQYEIKFIRNLERRKNAYSIALKIMELFNQPAML